MNLEAHLLPFRPFNIIEFYVVLIVNCKYTLDMHDPSGWMTCPRKLSSR